jgi:hypothetical protein
LTTLISTKLQAFQYKINLRIIFYWWKVDEM